VTSIFSPIPFVAHSGATLPFKIDCDGLTDDDITALAAIVGSKLSFSRVYGVPYGGERLAAALWRYSRFEGDAPSILIVDDVLTTGKSMLEARQRYPGSSVTGLVIFSRIDLAADPALSWIRPIFTLAPWIRK
jgi:orotate phosphoribosyltransferase